MDAIDGSIPAEQIHSAVERLRRDPPHPGTLVRVGCLGNSTTVSEAARQLGLAPPELERILAGKSGISPDLAVKMEALGWGSADLWVKLQSAYDLVQARRRAQRAA
ncbi:MAG: HigA family addiction module antitoxin [Bryobacterales bacterium]|nr:HigA family addiction module antitoxin [Bryobacterales bacterium]MDE0623196.1 HigA family addiction module antitoxin [Bryobacterales bacterium]